MGASDSGKLSPAGDLHHKCHNYVIWTQELYYYYTSSDQHSGMARGPITCVDSSKCTNGECNYTNYIISGWLIFINFDI